MERIKLVIDNSVLDEYNKFYFGRYRKRRKAPIVQPTHPSLNKWMIMSRVMANDLKGKWKDFIVWFVEKNKMTNKKINKCSMMFIYYFKTKIRKDIDNLTPKFILDGFVQSGLLIDDDSFHMSSLTMKVGYDKNNPRTEIYINVMEEEDNA